MGNILKQKLEMTDSFHIFGGSFFVHPSPEAQTKHNIKETDSKGNIWVQFYIPKGDGFDSG